jgi:hypothetical protein
MTNTSKRACSQHLSERLSALTERATFGRQSRLKRDKFGRGGLSFGGDCFQARTQDDIGRLWPVSILNVDDLRSECRIGLDASQARGEAHFLAHGCFL